MRNMGAAQDAINAAFAKDGKLTKRIFDAIDQTPQHLQLFHDIASYHTQFAQYDVQGENGSQPSKKRKLNIDGLNGGHSQNQPRSIILEARDLSFTLPQRKKLHLSIVQYGQGLAESDTSFALCITNPSTNEVEVEIPLSAFGYALKVPVPEKAQKQYNFCLLPPTQPSVERLPTFNESVIWSVNESPLKSCVINSPELQAVVGVDDVFDKALNAVLERTGQKITVPSESEFASAIPEAHRKNQKAYHVKAHRGSKDGFLFFLENGIFFGFKKPLAFFPFHDIDSVSYTAVLQRTFNLVITIQHPQSAENSEPEEVEFAMIDQADFAGIDAYIKQHQLQDASLADARRAKQYKVNGKSATQCTEADGQSELQKAEAEIQEDEEDEEDAMEEDYDPGSEGESEGSGSSDEEDQYNYKASGKDLVKDELGSEAEDVSVTDSDAEVEEDEDEEEPDHPPDPTPQVTQEKQMKTSEHIPHSPVLPHHPASAPAFDDEDQL